MRTLYCLLVLTVSLSVAGPALAAEVESVTTTPSHPFYVLESCQGDSDDGRWVQAEQLQVGDCFLLANAKRARLTEHERPPIAEPPRLHPTPVVTYNFTVSDFHTYFAGSSGVWVHNMCAEATPLTVETYSELVREYYPRVRGYIIKNLRRRGIEAYWKDVDELTQRSMISSKKKVMETGEPRFFFTTAKFQMKSWFSSTRKGEFASERPTRSGIIDIDSIVGYESHLPDSMNPVFLKEVIPGAPSVMPDVLLAERNMFVDELVQSIQKKLTPRELQLFNMHFGFEGGAGLLTDAAIGEALGLSSSRIQQVRIAMMRKVKDHAEALRNYRIMEILREYNSDGID